MPSPSTVAEQKVAVSMPNASWELYCTGMFTREECVWVNAGKAETHGKPVLTCSPPGGVLRGVRVAVAGG